MTVAHFSILTRCSSQNWAGFESSTTSNSYSQQFTIGTESLNGLIGTVRPGNYDSQTLPRLGGQGSTVTNNSIYVPQIGDTNNSPATQAGAIALPASTAYSWYHTSISGERPLKGGNGAYYGTDRTSRPILTAKYQYNIDSKLFKSLRSNPSCF